MLYCTMIVQDLPLVRMECSLDEKYSEVTAFKERNIGLKPQLFCPYVAYDTRVTMFSTLLQLLYQFWV